ncbi:MAG: hypothetical protein MUF18_10350, partial [Fimbriiglobus sp.]|nr:hypothetical protein [Fimbriiglobus sp.]
MLNRVWAAAAVTGLVIGGAYAADEAITLKIRKAAKGDVIKETKTEDVDTAVNITVGGQKQEQNDKAGSKFVYTEEVLEKAEKDVKPTKLKRTYESAEVVKKGEKVD